MAGQSGAIRAGSAFVELFTDQKKLDQGLAPLAEATRALHITAARRAAAKGAQSPRERAVEQGWHELFQVAVDGTDAEAERLKSLWAGEPDDTRKLAEVRAAAVMYKSALEPADW